MTYRKYLNKCIDLARKSFVWVYVDTQYGKQWAVVLEAYTDYTNLYYTVDLIDLNRVVSVNNKSIIKYKLCKGQSVEKLWPRHKLENQIQLWI